MTDIRDDHVKVHVRMDIDEHGWPPASVESLWAVILGDSTVRLDNTPWFVFALHLRSAISFDTAGHEHTTGYIGVPDRVGAFSAGLE